MVCTVKIYEKPRLENPVLLEGLPGIGFVANIAALHLIRELNAKVFAEIYSSAFQDLAVTTENGNARPPFNELYYYRGENGERDLMILYGNTQALTSYGQYELCWKILDLAEELGCRYIITMGGLRKEEKIEKPKLYFAAADLESAKEALSLGAEIFGGNIFGMAGLLVALGKLRGFRGFCLLAETPGYYPDAVAARAVLEPICRFLNLKVDFSRLDIAAEATRRILEDYGILSREERGKRERPGESWII